MKKLLVILGIMLAGLAGYWISLQKPTPSDFSLIEEVLFEFDERLSVVEADTAKFGAIQIPDAPYLLQTTLAEPISTAATSMTLNNGTIRGGSTLTGYQCFTVDGGKVETEYICGTASGTAVTALVRGIDPLNPAATSSAAIYSHRRGADVRTTDYPIVQILKRLSNGQDGFPGVIKYDTSISTSTIGSSVYNLANVNYVNGVALQGAPTATTTVPGVVQIGTASQIGASIGQTGVYSLVPAGSLFSATFRSATTVPVTNAAGKLAQGFLDLSENFVWTGAHTFNATTTFSSSTTFSGAVTFSGSVSGANRFGGDASDGTLSISSGTTTVNCGGLLLCIKNYDSVSITGTGVLDFINPHASGTIVLLKVKNNFTVTCSNAPCIDVSEMGAASSTGVSASSNTAGNTGNQGVGKYFITQGGGPGGASSAGSGGGSTIGQTFANSAIYRFFATSTKYTDLFVGASGGSGGVRASGSGVGPSGIGGRGGGALVIEVGGYWNFTTANGISVKGQNGGNGTATNANTAAGGGGGGAGGFVLALYNNLTANSGTINVSGGTGGNCASQSGEICHGAGGGGSFENAGSAGSSSTSNGAKTGGDGASGSYIVQKNTDY